MTVKRKTLNKILLLLSVLFTIVPLTKLTGNDISPAEVEPESGNIKATQKFVSSASELNSALSSANNGDVINITGTIEGSFTVPSGVTLKGGEITGLTNISGGWIQYSGNIYRKEVSATDIKYLFINGQSMHKGRWPNDTWAIIDGDNSNTYLRDADLLEIADDYFNGGEVVLRISSFWMNVRTITDKAGDRIIYSASTYGVDQGFGYFVQNHVNCLDINGEWAYDGTYVYIYYQNPNSLDIKVSTREIGLSLEEGSILDQIKISGYNRIAVDLGDNSNQQVKNCVIQYSAYGISGHYSADALISNNKLMNIGDIGINITNGTSILVTGNTLRSIGTYPGYGSNGLIGIRVSETIEAVISYNDIDSTGYCGIIQGGSIKGNIVGNRINNYCILADDGGGIYVNNFDNGLISNNFIQSANGDLCIPSDKWKDYANMGIYLDGINANNTVEIKDNLIIAGKCGIFVNPSNNITITGNILAKHSSKESFNGLLWTDAGSNHNVHDNLFITDYINQSRHALAHVVRNMPSSHTYRDNYYLLATGQIDGSDIVIYYGTYMSVQSWMEEGYGSSEHSDIIQWDPSYNVTKEDFVDYDFNFSSEPRSYGFKPGFLYYNPVTGRKVSSLVLPPYSGKVLYKTKDVEIPAMGGSEEEKTKDVEFKLFPNPSSDFVTVEINDIDVENISFHLYNMNGTVIQNEMITDNETIIDIRKLPPAAYLFNIDINQRTSKLFKIIKN